MELKEKIHSLAASKLEEIIKIRRHLHANPELSFKEFETCEYVASVLDKAGISYKKGIVETGIVALIEGKNPSRKVIALRADLDALPIQEANDKEYRSKNKGVMHACGHDVHTASLLGAALILMELKERFEGTIKLIFQPGEEKLPGGASLMIKEGVLKDPAPAAIIGQHVFPELEAGKVGFRAGKYMASSDEIYITVKGKGGHGGMPHQCIDPILIAAHVVVALQQITSRNAYPIIPTVLSFGKIEGGKTTNVIPGEVCLAGTLRTLDEKWRSEVHEKIKKITEGVCTAMGGQAEVTIIKGTPCVYNEERLTEQMRKAAEDYLGRENVTDLDLRMTAEDFAFYTQHIPGCFYRLGVRNEAMGITSSVHTPTFDIDEKALETGMGLMAWLAVESLKAESASPSI